MTAARVAIVLAGGRSSRLGRDKLAESIGGGTSLDAVLAACAAWADGPTIVVGPPTLPLPTWVHRTLEDPPQAGPVVALRAGFEAAGLGAAGLGIAGLDEARVAVLAADQPFLDAAGLAQLTAGLAGHEAAAFADPQGQVQFLCAVWRSAPLRARLAAAGRSMRSVYAGADVALITDARGVAADVDTLDDLASARARIDETKRG